MSKKIAYILRQAPYGSDLAHDAIDAALAAGLYGQETSLFFSGDGVFQLLKPSASHDASNEKTIDKKISALALYDIENVYVCRESLLLRGIAPEQLCIDVTPLDKQAFDNSIRQHDSLLSF